MSPLRAGLFVLVVATTVGTFTAASRDALTKERRSMQLLPSQEVPMEDLPRYEPFVQKARSFIEEKNLNSNAYEYIVYDMDDVIAVALLATVKPRGLRGSPPSSPQYTLGFDRKSGELVHQSLMR